MVITVPITINVHDIKYRRHTESDIDPSDASSDRVVGYSHEVDALWATGTDSNGNLVRVNILNWSGLKTALEEEMDNQ